MSKDQVAQPNNSKEAEQSLTFWQHLTELRNRIAIALLSIIVAAGLSGVFWKFLYGLLRLPLDRAGDDIKLNYLSVTEPFFMMIKIAIFGGLILASPVVIWQVWAFIAPGLKPNERRVVSPLIPIVLSLFLIGVMFVYIMLLPLSLGFLIDFAPSGMEAELTIDRYFRFVMGLILSGGLLFQLPAILGVLGYLGHITARQLVKQTGTATVVLMILAAVITPTGDAFNMLALTIPLMLLYFIGILVVWLIQRRQRNKARASESE